MTQSREGKYFRTDFRLTGSSYSSHIKPIDLFSQACGSLHNATSNTCFHLNDIQRAVHIAWRPCETFVLLMWTVFIIAV